ncbi:MAG: heparan-alpha-glucosaminide N-acetyltransferase [Pseudomonadota bacterium]
MTVRLSSNRLDWLDATRGMALVAMTIYHFTWDLEFFGYVQPGTVTSGGWVIFARSIAASFLLIVGVSLSIAAARGLNTKSYLKRTAIVATAALVITTATLFATPNSFIFFGILHHIALASLLGLVLIRTRTAFLFVVIIAIGGLQFGFAGNAVFDPKWLAWTGLYDNTPRSNDFVPLVPWFAFVVVGLILGRYILKGAQIENRVTSSDALKPIRFIGRHSLAYYLLHQPVLIAFIASVWYFFPPAPQSGGSTTMMQSCQQTCGETHGGEFCEAYCECGVGFVLNNPNPDLDELQTVCEAEAITRIDGDEIQ